MPLSSSTNRRALKHTRTIQIEAFARDDGLWDLDARITDYKPRDITLASGVRPNGSALHDLSLRVTIDLQFNVLDAESISEAVPYPGYCEAIGPAYKKLIGLNLLRQFRQGVKERLSGVEGCTHLSEMAQILPTAAVQAFAGDVIATRDGATDRANTGATDAASQSFSSDDSCQPFQLDRCHALRLDGPAALKYYPRWAKNPSNAKSPS